MDRSALHYSVACLVPKNPQLSLVTDSNFAFIWADFAVLFLKVSKYINTGQTSAIVDVDYPSLAKLFLCYQE